MQCTNCANSANSANYISFKIITKNKEKQRIFEILVNGKKRERERKKEKGK
jgi:hypothetical protein